MKEKYFRIVNSIGAVQRTAKNPFTKSHYAKLSKIQEAICPILEQEQCYILFDFGTFVDDVYICNLTLQDVETDAKMEWKFAVPLDNTQSNRAQAFGSTTTYAQRYGLCIAFQIALDDTDPDAQAAQTPVKTLPELKHGSDAYNKAVAWMATTPGSTIEQIKAKYAISQQVMMKIQEDVLNYETPKQ